MRNVQRILDANANRAREALRVMEDAARFLLDDTKLAGRIKTLRHDLASAMARVPGVELHRDTPGDVGTSISTDAESTRQGPRHVVVAAGKRLTEALRCIEEYGKVIDADLAATVERLRYHAYELERQLHAKLGPPMARQWRLCVIVSDSMCEHHDWADVAKASLDAGADCIQLREKALEGGELFDRAAALTDLASPQRRAIIINDRPDIALASGATGVHLGQGDMPIEAARRLAPRLVIGASTHNLAEAKRAVTAGADYCGVGAVFATATKQRKPTGTKYVAKFVERYPRVSHLAIGGITPDNIAEVVAAGARGVAVSSIVCSAKRPGAIVKKLLRAVPTI